MSYKISYTYQKNSCYLDTILFILLNNPILLKRILNENINEISYNPSQIISSSSKMISPKHIQLVATYIQKLLKIDIEKFKSNTNNSINSSLLRKKLGLLLPQILGKSYVFGSAEPMFNICEIYDLFCELYPKLKMIVPYKNLEDGTISNFERSTLCFTDYLNNNLNKQSKINFDGIESNIIVFQNEGNKENGFDEIISLTSNESHRLFAVVLLHGVKNINNNNIQGSHYTTFFRTLGTNDWCHYDDVGCKITKYIKLPQSVFQYSTKTCIYPEMYFYYKIKRV